MRVTLRLSNAIIYDVSQFDVKKGESFSLSLSDTTQNIEWFSNNDPVLSVIVTGYDADLVAQEAGKSLIMLMEGTTILKTLDITIIEEVIPMATELGLEASEPEPKS